MSETYQQSPAWYTHRMRMREIGTRIIQGGSLDIDSMPPEVARWAIEALKPIAEVRTERDQMAFEGVEVRA